VSPLLARVLGQGCVNVPVITVPKSKPTLDDEGRQLIEDQLQAVKSIASHMARRLPASVDRADLVQDGLLGLIEALLRWTRQTTGAHFENYVALRTRGAMLDGLRTLDHGRRHVRKEMRRVEVAIQQLGHRHGRPPTEPEVAGALGLELPDYQRLLQDAEGYVLISLQDLAGEDSDQYLEECIADASDPLVLLERAALRAALAGSVRRLPAQKRELLTLIYERDLRLHEIGKQFGLSESRISQLHAQTIAQLRATMPQGDVSSLLRPRRKPRPAPGPVGAETP
jgi:RNA polymerase sigma factor for flagellar operon FliA